ncbi:MAG: hypothetical protein JSV91_15940 [Phycisphaerales bacterium]|nr:MAG: hypothetical protein JSV91_15940 [Phycisphaerales bacterium]
MCDHDCCCDKPAKPRKRVSILGMLFKLILLYVILVYSGGTLQHIKHPVANETGKLIHTVTLVEPSIHWADHNGYRPLSAGLRFLANGADVNKAIMAVNSAKTSLTP